MKRHFPLFLIFSHLVGCTAWTQTQTDLITEARRGIALVSQSDAQRDAALSELARLRRQRLDDAFDQDVRERESLAADWVVDARKAYALALDAYAKTQASAEQSAQTRRRNLADVDAALQRLQWLVSIQSKFNFWGNQP